jgi:ribonuclease HI
VDPLASGYRLRLHAFCEALEQLDPGAVVVHTSDPAVQKLWEAWLPRWLEDPGGRRRPPADADLLQRIAARAEGFELSFQISRRRTTSHAKDTRRLALRAAELIRPEDVEAAVAEVEITPRRRGFQTVAWADGSARGNPGPAGWGMALLHVPSGTTLSRCGGVPRGTNNQMELMAVLEVLRSVRRPGARLEVRTDSRFVIQVATTWRHGWKRRGWRKADGDPPANLELIMALDAELERVHPTFTWIRGHAGEPGNEYVDGLAHGAATAMSEGRETADDARSEAPPFVVPPEGDVLDTW